MVSTHSRPKAAGQEVRKAWRRLAVSTHSRPKAAGSPLPCGCLITACFNTQPPEGGWAAYTMTEENEEKVSTHSRPKAAGIINTEQFSFFYVSTHSRPKAAGCLVDHFEEKKRCFNTQPPEGGWARGRLYKTVFTLVSTHSRPKAAGVTYYPKGQNHEVSTHSRPKAAGLRFAK